MTHTIPRQLDRDWYEKQLAKLPYQYRARAVEGYRRVWLEAYESEPVCHKKENAASRAANIRLRGFIDQVMAAR